MQSTSLPVMVLVFIGVLIALLGLFAAGNIMLIGLGVASIAIGGVLQVLGQRRS